MVGYFCGNSLLSGVNGYIAPTCESLLNVCRKFWVHRYTIVKSKGSSQICQRSLNFQEYFHSCRMDRENFSTDYLCFFFMHHE